MQKFEQFVSKEDLPSDFSQLDDSFTPLTQPLEPFKQNMIGSQKVSDDDNADNSNSN